MNNGTATRWPVIAATCALMLSGCSSMPSTSSEVEYWTPQGWQKADKDLAGVHRVTPPDFGIATDSAQEWFEWRFNRLTWRINRAALSDRVSMTSLLDKAHDQGSRVVLRFSDGRLVEVSHF